MKKRSGITLVELLLTLAFISVVVLISTNMLLLGNKAQSITMTEFDIQSNTRVMVEYINNITRYATKAHTIPKSSFQYSEHGVRDPNTSYIGITKEGHVVVDDPGKEEGDPRKIQYLAKKTPGIDYEMFFEKEFDEEGNEIPNILKFSIKGMKNGKEVSEIVSSVEVLNTMQIEYLGTTTDPAVALAFTHTDLGRSQWIKVAPDAYIVMVLDTSGSMEWDMDGKGTDTENARITILKQKATDMINRLSELDFNIYVSIVPFSERAYRSTNFTDYKLPAKLREFHNVNTYEGRSEIINNQINKLRPTGGTNTGDGMRRGYYLLKNKAEEILRTKEQKDFTQHMMILVDGGTNLESYKSDWWSTYLFEGDGNPDYTGTPPRLKYDYTAREWIYSNRYVNLIGNKITSLTIENDGEKTQIIKPFVIGFSNRTIDHSSLEDIGTSCNALKFPENGNKPYIIATNADDLDFAFEEFESEVVKDLWLMTRPKLLP